MIRNKSFKAASLAAAIALAMGSTAVMAQTAPTATQLPGMGNAVAGKAVAGDIAKGVQTITVDPNTVINWGVPVGKINAEQPGGFNVGSAASLSFEGGNVLNVDRSGKMSQIMGTLKGDANLFVANANGIIVGKTASVSASDALGLIANVTGDQSTFTGDTIPYMGTGGGDLTVMKGATLAGDTILLAGGNTVNVDISALTAGTTVQAGRNQNVAFDTNENTGAMINLTGDGDSSADLDSAGDISNTGKLNLTGGSVVADSMFTNDGVLTANTTDFSKAKVTNNGELSTSQSATFKALTNSGDYTVNGDLTVKGGRLTNEKSGAITLGTDGEIVADSVNNHGTINKVKSITSVGSEKGSSYSINNDGTISGDGSLTINANSNAGSLGTEGTEGTDGEGGTAGTAAIAANGTRGEFTNNGILNVGNGGSITVSAANVISLGDKSAINMAGEATSEDNAFGGVTFTAGNLVRSYANLWVDGNASMTADQIALFGSVIATGTNGNVTLDPGDKSDSGYSLRVASGTTTSAVGTLTVEDTDGGNPNIILQGMLSGNTVNLGSAANPVSDVFSGPNGGIAVTGGTAAEGQVAGTNAQAQIHFTGAVKTAPYLNNANGNFRYNYLPISSDNPLELTLNPVAYATNGTSNGKAGVNVLVNNSVTLADAVTADMANAPDADDSAVTGVTDLPNTHLVLQSTGDITTGMASNDSGAFYWPGYVYLGTIAKDSDDNAMPGTLGFGTITTTGVFNNVLAGNVNNGGGIHFITQLPLDLNGNVITNANSFVNFGTDTLTNGYKNGSLTGDFFGGEQGAGKVVNYGELDASKFHTAPPVASR